jgi:hypothetical protein
VLIALGALLVWPTGGVVTGVSVEALGAILIVVGFGGVLAAATSARRRDGPQRRQ